MRAVFLHGIFSLFSIQALPEAINSIKSAITRMENTLKCIHISPRFSEECPNGFDLTTVQDLWDKSLCSWEAVGIEIWEDNRLLIFLVE